MHHVIWMSNVFRGLGFRSTLMIRSFTVSNFIVPIHLISAIDHIDSYCLRVIASAGSSRGVLARLQRLRNDPAKLPPISPRRTETHQSTHVFQYRAEHGNSWDGD